MTVERPGAREKQTSLDRPPHPFRDPLGPLDLVPIGWDVVDDKVGRLVLVQDCETQPYRLSVRERLDQLVVEQELAGRFADVLLTP